MRLAEFIQKNIESLLREWEAFARSLDPAARMPALELRDDAEAILRACARDMDTSQSEPERLSKSRGHGGRAGTESAALDSASNAHGLGRVHSGFNLNEVLSEYRAIRASVLRLWRESKPKPDLQDLDDITRFNEAIDQSLANAVARYSLRVEQSRRMFLAILSHDLRNPLSCIQMSAFRAEFDHGMVTDSVNRIRMSAEAIARLADDLLDFASTGLGAGIRLTVEVVDLGKLAREAISELQAAHPGARLHFESRGDLLASCDGARIRQLLSNLVGNAIHHGDANEVVHLLVASEGQDIVVVVRNKGRPIPADVLPTIFEPLVRAASTSHRRRTGSVGLGLYIVREIVKAHAGSVDVKSDDSETVFTVRFPRPAAPTPCQLDSGIGPQAKQSHQRLD